MDRIRMDLQLFAEGGEGGGTVGDASATPTPAAADPAAGTEQFRVGDTLGNGQQVHSAQVAAELTRQMKRHPELKRVYGQRPQQAAQPVQQQTEQAEEKPAEKSIQEKWDALKKGEYKELYGQDVQKAIQDRFKNQADLQRQLDELQPILEAGKKIYGVQDTAALRQAVENDDRLHQAEEEEAEAAGMSVEAYRTMQQLKAENERHAQMEQQSIQEQKFRNHIAKLAQQAEELRKVFPDFDLRTELQDPRFMRLTSPEVGISVEDAFYAIHGKQVAAQSMKAGMERTQKQLGQTIRAQGMRPIEGAAHGQGQPAARAPMDFRSMTRAEREKFRSQVKTGKVVIPGR